MKLEKISLSKFDAISKSELSYLLGGGATNDGSTEDGGTVDGATSYTLNPTVTIRPNGLPADEVWLSDAEAAAADSL
ncbi:MAG: TIGR04149 family rSAM-modified RiPP [Prevotellaceae bacterium]|jgi:natural product precursor|nr:TIGR04149 family rSAM-modified RiPP [Prevotellaceae bacterium]